MNKRKKDGTRWTLEFKVEEEDQGKGKRMNLIKRDEYKIQKGKN